MDWSERPDIGMLDEGRADSAVVRRIAALTRARDTALAAAVAERQRNAVLMQQCENLAGEIFGLRRGQARTSAIAEAKTRQLTAELEYARATIRNMERSWFWRLRLLSVQIRQIGRRARNQR